MAYQTEPLEDADFAIVVPKMFEAMGTDYEYVNALYAGHQTEAGQKKIAAQFIARKKAVPNSKWIKAVDRSSGEIVGFALWSLIDKETGKPPEVELDGPPGTWPSEEEKKYCQAMYRVLLKDRRRVIRENEVPIMIMSMIATFKEHQRGGVGKLMMKWGLDLADDINAICTVEATKAGMLLYKECGFRVEHEFDLDAGEQYADRPKDHLWFMVRSRNG